MATLRRFILNRRRLCSSPIRQHNNLRCESRCRSLTAINSSFDDEEQHEGSGQRGGHYGTKVAGATIGLSFMAFKGSRMSLNAEDSDAGEGGSQEPRRRPKTAPSTNDENASSLCSIEAIIINDKIADVTTSKDLKRKEKKSRQKILTVSGEESESSSDESEEEEDEGKKEPKKEAKERVGFRDRKIIDYENRIRAYSTPDKIFRYFATYRSIVDSEVFMTPADFLRSLTPNIKQPEHLGLDQFKKFDPKVTTKISREQQDLQGIDEESIFYHLGCSGLISFSDYIFLLTILSTSKRQFEIAFRMFDLNGDGDVDAEEFAQVQNIIRQTTSVGKRHRDQANTGNTLKGMNSALANFFFGENLDGKLTIERFLDFQEQLQREILRLEFNRKPFIDEAGTRIWERDFADLLLTYADYTPKKRSAVLKRVKKKYPNKADQEDPVLGITSDDYIQIFSLLLHIDDVDKALYFYNLAGASIDPRTLQHVAKVCANVDLSDHVVGVIFTIFDEDGDGALSNKEFVAVMKNKLKRGLEKPKDTGLFNFLTAVTKCAKLTPKTVTEAVARETFH